MPHKKTKKPRQPERDYSQLSLLDKLGVNMERIGDSTGRLDDRQLAGV